jgi:hypothetical protein
LRLYGASRSLKEIALVHHLLTDLLIAAAFLVTFAGGYSVRALSARRFRRDGFW